MKLGNGHHTGRDCGRLRYATLECVTPGSNGLIGGVGFSTKSGPSLSSTSVCAGRTTPGCKMSKHNDLHTTHWSQKNYFTALFVIRARPMFSPIATAPCFKSDQMLFSLENTKSFDWWCVLALLSSLKILRQVKKREKFAHG